MIKIITREKYKNLLADIEDLHKKHINDIGQISKLEDTINKNSETIARLAATDANKLPLEIEEYKKSIKQLKDDINNIEQKAHKKRGELTNLEAEIEHYDELQTISAFIPIDENINSNKIKNKINKNKSDQKGLIKKGEALSSRITPLEKKEDINTRHKKKTGKFILKTFNTEVDHYISGCTRSNISTTYKKIYKCFENMNNYGSEFSIAISHNYLELRLDELKLVYGYNLRLQIEKEERRYIQDSIREEKRVQKEIEEFIQKKEQAEIQCNAALKNAEGKLGGKSQGNIDKLMLEINRLKDELKNLSEEKERALSLAQITRSGHVYIISNKGSFGDGIYKIGMTRRLDPMDRVKELGDASVPFFFDVHGIIPSEDAPGLEKKLHKHFAENRVNKINYRREFFKVSIDEIEKALCAFHGKVNLTRSIKAAQWKESLLIDGSTP
jgi:hypothetical protein